MRASPERCVFIFHERYYADVGRHVLQAGKYQKTRDRLREAGLPARAFLAPRAATQEEMGLVHTPAYMEDLICAVHTARTAPSELPISEEIVQASFLAAGGTIRAAREAIRRGRALNLTGGFHHAFADRAEGFCYVNDLAVAVRVLQREGVIARAAVIDCDLHQGNGTAAIFRGDDAVLTFSIHQENIYPRKARSDIDVGLRDLATWEEYLPRLEEHIPGMLDAHKPDLVLYQAGADPYSGDQLGTLQLSKDALGRRDAYVLGECRARAIPVAGTLGGGYALDPADTVDIHFQTAMRFWEA